MKRLIVILAVMGGLSLASCMEEKSPYGSNPDAKSKNNSATPVTQDTIARDNTGTMQNGGTSTNGNSSTGGGTGNGGQ